MTDRESKLSVSVSGPILTESSVLLVQLPLHLLLGTSSEQPVEDDVEVAEDDEWRRQDGPVMEGHDQLISLKLPHLVGDGLHLHESVAVGIKRSEVSQHKQGINVCLSYITVEHERPT